MNYTSIANQTLDLVKTTGKFIREQRLVYTPDKTETKGLHDLVSYVDKTAEAMLVKELKQILPQAGFITEENTATHQNEDFIWVIDPLDGTTNFIHNVTPYAISVALMYKNTTVLGIVYEVGLNEMFYSWENEGVYCNQKPINVSQAKNLSDGLIATGFHISDYGNIEHHLKSVEIIIRNSHGIRRHGSAATDLAYVAAGRFEAFFEYGLSPWDVAAGQYLVTKAGGAVTDFKGGPNHIFGRQILAANKPIHQQMLNIINRPQ
jgi:myo-inositol-1(or 4)-monophosphatase